MRAVVIDPKTHQLELTELADPMPDPHQVLVRIRAAGLGFSDLAARSATFSASGSATAAPVGAELAGEIATIGTAVTGWQVGDPVMARGHGLAEFAAVDADHLLAVPPELNWDEAGAAPTALLTAYNALVMVGQLRAGQTVLVHAATSGVGHIAVRMASELGARMVIAASRSDHKLGLLRDIVGETAARFLTVNTSTGEIAADVLGHTNGRGADLVFDLVGADVLAGNIAATAVGGRIVQVGRVSGKLATIDLDELARKQLALVGVSFRTRSPADIAEIVQACAASLAGHYAQLRPRVHRSYPMTAASAAFDDLERADFVGKIVVNP